MYDAYCALMKRFISFSLSGILVVLLAGNYLFIQPAAAQLTTRAYSWQAPSISQPNIIPFCWVGTYAWPGQMYPIGDIAGITAHLLSMPAGHRCLFLWNQHRDMVNFTADELKDSITLQVQGFTDTLLVFHPFPTVWWDSGAAYVARFHDTLFSSLAAAGAPLDMVVLDFEQNVSNWTLSSSLNGYAIHPADKDSILTNLYTAISADARSPSMLSQLGFTDLLKVKNYMQNGNEYLVFNDYWWSKRSAYIQTAIVDPLHQYYPQAKLSNYGDVHVSGDFPVPDLNGHQIYCCNNTGTHSGTHQSGSYYGGLGQICTTNLPPGVTTFDCTPFQALLFTTNHMKSARLSNPAPLIGWVAFPSFQENNKIQFCNSPYFFENLFHLLLSGSQGLLYWNPTFPSGPPDPVHWQEAQQVSQAMLEFDSFWMHSFPDTTLYYPADTITSWDAPYVLTGMESDSLVLWRFTPRLDSLHTSPVDYLVSNNPLSFHVMGVPLTFPPGSFIDSNNAVSQAGLWIARNKNTTTGGTGDLISPAFHVSPNPFINQINISSQVTDYTCVLSTLLNQEIYAGTNIRKQDFSFLQKGVYILKIKPVNSPLWKNFKLLKQ